MSILQYKKNIFSQNGEDGLIEYIFSKILGNNSGTFIEFGAWDGKYLSNTYNLFLNKNWNGIYIEGDTEKYNDLCDNFRAYKDRIDCVNAFVGFDENDKLDKLIEIYSTKRNFDFISIDVDGLDYFIFEKLVKYLPKVICIEVNAGHDPEYGNIIPKHIAENNIGQSIKVITDLATLKGYFPLCYNGNLFLVQNMFKHLFTEHIKSIQDIYMDFLNYSEPDAIEHLKRTFIDTNYYNDFLFKNFTLYNFIIHGINK
jgi:hypothetical protein